MNQPTPPAEPQPETAHALLWRHGLPEDIIDGALCLHAQELAAQQRAVIPDDSPAWVKTIPDLIEPGVLPPAEFAVPAAETTNQPALRDRIVAAVWRLHDTGGVYALDAGEYDRIADAVLAVLPPTTDRAAILREAADQIDETRAPFPIAVQNGIIWATAELRRAAAADAGGVAAEEQPETQTDPCSGCRYVPCGNCQPAAVSQPDGEA